MECQGDDCDVDDYLWLKTCDENDSEDEQQFLYEPLPAFGGGRIKPYHDQSLCWERTRVNAYQLRPCSPLNDLNTTQIVIGFDESGGRFEMHPYGWDANSTTSENGAKCINNHHHPKSDEIVRAEFCSSSRSSRVSRWVVYNPVTLTPTGDSGGGQGGGPEVNPVGGDYCTPSNPCPQCYGDCDGKHQADMCLLVGRVL